MRLRATSSQSLRIRTASPVDYRARGAASACRWAALPKEESPAANPNAYCRAARSERERAERERICPDCGECRAFGRRLLGKAAATCSRRADFLRSRACTRAASSSASSCASPSAADALSPAWATPTHQAPASELSRALALRRARNRALRNAAASHNTKLRRAALPRSSGAGIACAAAAGRCVPEGNRAGPPRRGGGAHCLGGGACARRGLPDGRGRRAHLRAARRTHSLRGCARGRAGGRNRWCGTVLGGTRWCGGDGALGAGRAAKVCTLLRLRCRKNRWSMKTPPINTAPTSAYPMEDSTYADPRSCWRAWTARWCGGRGRRRWQ